MKTTQKYLSLAFMILFGFTAQAQEDTERKTLFNKNVDYQAGFGSTLFGFTQLRGTEIFQVGGEGGLILNKRWGIGFYGIGLSKVTFTQNTQTVTTNGGHGGLLLEYISQFDNVIHLAFPLRIGLGSFRTQQGQNKTKSSIGVIIPGLSVQLNIHPNAILFVTASYRYFYSETSNPLLSSSDISDASFLFGIKFGEF